LLELGGGPTSLGRYNIDFDRVRAKSKGGGRLAGNYHS